MVFNCACSFLFPVMRFGSCELVKPDSTGVTRRTVRASLIGLLCSHFFCSSCKNTLDLPVLFSFAPFLPLWHKSIELNHYSCSKLTKGFLVWGGPYVLAFSSVGNGWKD